MESVLSVEEEYDQMKTLETMRSRGLDYQAEQGARWLCGLCGCRCRRGNLRHHLPIEGLRRFVHGPLFGNIVLAVIFLNVIFSALAMDSEVRMHVEGRGGPLPQWFALADLIFLGLFATELLFRLVAEEMFFFVGEHWKWNVFDLLVVLSAAMDTLSQFSGVKLNFVRVIRVLRMFRSMKIMRVVRFCDELRVMLLQIVGSLKPMLWAFVFLGLIILMFALVFTQGVISYFEDLELGRIPEPDEYYQGLQDLCYSFPMATLSLFMSITGGINWWAIAEPLMQVSPLYVCLFLLYILVLMIGVLNIIVGIFVESATNAAVRDREALTKRELEKNVEMMKGLEELFDQLDESRKGIICWKHFEELTKRSKVRALFSALELDVSHAREVFKLMDLDGNGCIGIDEFVVGIMRSKGLAKRTDIHGLMVEISRMLRSLRRHTTSRLDRIEVNIAGLRGHVYSL